VRNDRFAGSRFRADDECLRRIPPKLKIRAAAQANNLIGQAINHYDPSGLATVERVDLSAKPAHITRTLVKMAADLLQEPEVLDWNPSRTAPLEGETFIQLTEYDALGRMTKYYNWHRDTSPGNSDRVAVYVPEYNKRGALVAEMLHVRATKHTANGKVAFTPSATPAHNTKAITEISYNVKGQKRQLTLGNDTITSYTYDDKTLRLTSLHTSRTNGSTQGMQDLSYTYDPVGNITQINDAAQATVYANNAVIRPAHYYVYDALYRLIEGTGRENTVSRVYGVIPTPDVPRNYTQHYFYDQVGNFVQMQHVPDTGTGWTRHYTTQIDSNRLHQTWNGGMHTNEKTYRHDAHGNMLNLNQTPQDWGLAIQWDWRDMMRGFDCIGGGIARYHYGIDKQRTRKHITRNPSAGGTLTEDRIYLGGYELYRRRNLQGEVVEAIESLHLFEGEQRVLLVDDVLTTNRNHANTTAYKEQPIYRYQYSNHLGSACLELDHAAEIISYEEYHPYGTSAYRLMKRGVEAPAKRYRYTGMERHEESGLGYHLARYYVPWLGRWGSCDPIDVSDGLNVFRYARNSPIVIVDRDGTQATSGVHLDVNVPSAKLLTQVPADIPAVPTTTASAYPPPNVTLGMREVAQQVQQLKEDPISRNGAIALAGLLTYWMPWKAKSQTGEPMGFGERIKGGNDATSMMLGYQLGFGYNTTRGFIGKDVSVQSVEKESLQNAVAMIPIIGKLRQGLQMFKAINIASAGMREWSFAQEAYKVNYLNAVTDSVGRPVTALEARGLQTAIERMAWSNWKLSPVQFKYSGNKGLDLHFEGVAENLGYRAFAEAKAGPGRFSLLSTPTTTLPVGGFTQGGEYYIGMSLSTYVERGGANTLLAEAAMRDLRAGWVKSFLSTRNNFFELRFSTSP
jgi:RHS repeat-associated protein